MLLEQFIRWMPFVGGVVENGRLKSIQIEWNEILKAGIIGVVVLYGQHIQLQDITARLTRMDARHSLTERHQERQIERLYQLIQERKEAS